MKDVATSSSKVPKRSTAAGAGKKAGTPKTTTVPAAKVKAAVAAVINATPTVSNEGGAPGSAADATAVQPTLSKQCSAADATAVQVMVGKEGSAADATAVQAAPAAWQERKFESSRQTTAFVKEFVASQGKAVRIDPKHKSGSGRTYANPWRFILFDCVWLIVFI